MIGQRKNDCLAILVAVELNALALLDVGVITFAETPQRSLPTNNRPAQTTRLVVGIEWRQVVTVTATEGSIFLEQAFLNIEPEVLGLIVIEAGSPPRGRAASASRLGW